MSSTNSATPGSRLFYPSAAVLFLVITFLGFIQFYLHGQQFPGRPISPPVRVLVIAHGVAMSLWIILYLLQTALVSSGHKALHMKLGWGIAALIPFLLCLGLLVSVRGAALAPSFSLFGYTRQQFTIVPISSIVTFCLFAGLGLYWRRKPAVHRPLMLLATWRLLPPALSRIAWVGRVFGPDGWTMLFAPLCLLGALLIVAYWMAHRRFEWTLFWGWAFTLASTAFVAFFGHTATWTAISAELIKI